MSETYRLPRIRTIFISIIIFVSACLCVIFRAGEAIKLVGAVFLFIPQQLNLVEQVSRNEVQVVDLSNPGQLVRFAKPGKYSIYYQMPFLTDSQSYAQNLPPALGMEAVESGKHVYIKYKDEGLRLYDSPHALGRSFFSFTIETPGLYRLIYFSRPVTISILPDYVTGHETTIILSYAIQLGILGFSIGAVLFVRFRRKQMRQIEFRQRSQKRDEAFQRTFLNH
jgi:hypothetical protein